MALLINVNGDYPIIDPTVWLADNAVITGNTIIGKESSIWFGVVIRGDVNNIVIGENVNIQDLSMVHGTYGRSDTVIGNNVSIGHRAIIHGCQIEENVLIGMGAIILDDVKIHSNCIIAAGAVVTSGTVLESGFIYAGVPARKLKPIDDISRQVYIDGTAQAYLKYKEWYNGTKK